MAYDEQLAARVSDLMHQRPGVRESKMFGGVGWMINGNMACGVMRHDHLMVRMAPEEIDEALREPHVHEFGRPGAKPMKGFVMIDPEALADDAELERWVECGAARASELRPK